MWGERIRLYAASSIQITPSTYSFKTMLPLIKVAPVFEPQRKKTYLLTRAPNKTSAHARSLISLRGPYEETFILGNPKCAQ